MAAKARRKTVASGVGLRGEVASPERMAHGDVRLEIVADDPKSKAVVRRYRDKASCKLDLYYRQGRIDGNARAAGMRFRNAWRIYFKCSGSDSTQACVAKVQSSIKKETLTERQVEASQTITDAYSAVEPLDREILRAVAGEDEAVSKNNIKKLSRILSRLAKHWGLE